MTPPDESQGVAPAPDSGISTLRHAISVVAGLTLFSVIVTGYSFITPTHEFTYVLLERMRDPSAYPGDAFVDVFAKFPSLYWKLVHAVRSVFTLETTSVLFFVVNRAMLIAAYYYLGYVFGEGDRRTAATSATLGAFGPPVWFGSVPIISHAGLYHTGFAIPFLLCAIATARQGRFAASFVLMALGSAINILYGLYNVLFLSIAYLARGDIRKRLPRLAAAAATGAMLAGGYALATGQLGNNLLVDSYADAIRFDVIFHTSPYHTSPHWQFLDNFIPTLLYLGLASGLIAIYWHKAPFIARFHLGGAIYCIALLFAWCFLAYIWQRGSLMALQPSRGNDLWYSLVAVEVIALSWKSVATSERWSRPGLMIVISIFAIQAYMQALDWNWQTNAIAIAGIIAIWSLKDDALPDAHRVAGITIAGILIATMLFAVKERAVRNEDIPGLDKFMERERVELTAEYPLAQWARLATTEDARFFAPPSWRYWRLFSRRATHILYEDALAAYLDIGAARLWSERMAEIGVNAITARGMRDNQGWADKLSQEIGDDARLRLARAYEIDYWILRQEIPTELPIAAAGGGYLVLDMRQRDPQERP